MKEYRLFIFGLALLFVALKLTGTITWPWWWVLAPVWVPTSIALLLGLLGAGILVATGKPKK